jgi:hypothetical protein
MVGNPRKMQNGPAVPYSLIAKLRGHGLVAKVPGARLYRITPHGHRVLTGVLTIHDQQFPTTFRAIAA